MKNTIAYGIGNPDPGLGQAQKCGDVKPVNGIQPMITRALEISMIHDDCQQQ